MTREDSSRTTNSRHVLCISNMKCHCGCIPNKGSYRKMSHKSLTDKTPRTIDGGSAATTGTESATTVIGSQEGTVGGSCDGRGGVMLADASRIVALAIGDLSRPISASLLLSFAIFPLVFTNDSDRVCN